jgi:drug/metabolite transporter (DMT)-like permease
MRVFLAYLGVVFLWSTTPLAIKWSGEGPGFLFGATARMTIGLVCVLFVLALARQPMPWRRKALGSYLAASLHIYAGMLSVYWAARFIPSGWVAVIFGLTPMLNAPMAALWLGERSLSLAKLLAYVLGVSGLAVMQDTAMNEGGSAMLGILGVLASSFLQAASAVWVKRLNAGLPALTLLGGGLLFSVPAYLATWAIFDGAWPESLPLASVASILYLGVIATTLGFSLYYFLLKHLSSMQVALIILYVAIN